MYGEGGFSEGNCSAHIAGETDVWRGRLSRILFKVLLYDDLVNIVTSGHVTKIVITLFDPPGPKSPVICKLYGSVF